MGNVLQLYNLEEDRNELLEHVMNLCQLEDSENIDGQKMLLLTAVLFEAVCLMSAKFEGEDGKHSALRAINDVLKNVSKTKA